MSGSIVITVDDMKPSRRVGREWYEKRLCLFVVGGIHQCLNLGGQTEQSDEAFGILLVVIAGTEGGDVFRVQGVVAPDTGFDDVALVELELY